MFGLCGRWVCAVVVLALCWPVPASAQPLLTNGFYTQNFDSMGQSGTAPPSGWNVFQIAGGSTTWDLSVGGIPGTSGVPVSGGTASTGLIPVLVDSSNTLANSTNNNNGLNVSTSANPNDRALGTVPTSVAGDALELQMVNGTGRTVNAITMGFDIRRFQPGLASGSPAAEELPGYWLFYSLDGGATFTNVPALNSDGTSVPNTVGVTNVPLTTFSLASPLANGSTIIFRWVDDNGSAPSPDEVLGLDNLQIAPSPVPEPGSLALCGLAAAAALLPFRRRRAAA